MEGMGAPGAQLDRPGAVWWAWDGVLLLVLAAIIGAAAVHSLFTRNPRRLPPGPRPWPILGSLPLLGELPHQALARLAQKYGPVMYLRLGSTPTVVVSSPDMAREFLQTLDHIFSNRANTNLTAYLHHSKNIAFSNGAYWRHLRKTCILELLTPTCLASFRNARTEEVTATMKAILEESREGKVVDLHSKLWSLTCTNMTRMLFNKRYFGLGVEGQKEAQSFKIHMDKIVYWFGAFIIGDFNPSLRWLSKLQGIDASLRKVDAEVTRFYQHVVEDHREAATKGRGSSYQPSTTSTDFVDVLLTMRTEDGRDQISDETIRLVLMDMMNAGTDTSSVTTEWAMAELLRHPDVMKRARTELDALVGASRCVQESDIPHLKYLQAIVKEVLRLHPPAPLLIPHESSEECQAAGYNLPAKTRLFVNVWAIGQDPSTWNRPFAFEPERFMDQHPDIDVKGHDFQLLPFGSGRRGCPGISLGLLMVQITLARLLHSFNWSLPNDQDPNTLDMSEVYGLTLHRKQPLHVVAHPRLAAHLYE